MSSPLETVQKDLLSIIAKKEKLLESEQLSEKARKGIEFEISVLDNCVMNVLNAQQHQDNQLFQCHNRFDYLLKQIELLEAVCFMHGIDDLGFRYYRMGHEYCVQEFIAMYNHVDVDFDIVDGKLIRTETPGRIIQVPIALLDKWRTMQQ